jgi:ApaG protein
MNTAITKGIQIHVQTNYRADLSHPLDSNYFFNYHIQIENHNNFDVQLLHRDWYIFDSLNAPNFVSGEGVIGEQPILKPGEIFSYTSGCDLFSEFGFMKGFYTFRNLSNEQLFEVLVPTFKLMHPPRLN